MSAAITMINAICRVSIC